MNYLRDGVNDDANENDDDAINRIKNDKTITSIYFEYKRKIIGRATSYNNALDIEVLVPLK